MSHHSSYRRGTTAATVLATCVLALATIAAAPAPFQSKLGIASGSKLQSLTLAPASAVVTASIRVTAYYGNDDGSQVKDIEVADVPAGPSVELDFSSGSVTVDDSSDSCLGFSVDVNLDPQTVTVTEDSPTASCPNSLTRSTSM